MRAIPLGILLFISQLLSAQEKLLPVFQFGRLTTADGLPSNEIRSNVVRDRAGFIWVGTFEGLARYDGHSCRVYRNEPGNPHSLSSNSVLRLLLDSQGRLWIGTYASGPSLYDPVRDRFVNFLPRKDDSLWFPGHSVERFVEEDPGTFWLVFADGQVVRFDLGAAANQTDPDSVARHLRVRCSNDSLFKGWVSRIVPWDEEHILASTGGGLYLVNRRTFELTRPNLPRVSAMLLDTIVAPNLLYENPNRLWFGTLLHGLYLLDKGKRSVTAYHKGKTDGPIQDMQIDNRGRMWIATGEGVDLFDMTSGSYKDYLPVWYAPGKSYFTQMSLDSSGILWISTGDDGVYFISPASFRLPLYGLRGPAGRPMVMETIDRANDGAYWIGTEGKLTKIRLETMQVERTIDVLRGKKSLYGPPGFWTSLDDGKGTLWLGTWGRGLFGVEPLTGRVRNFLFSEQSKEQGIKQDVCISLLERTSDTLWIAGYNDGLLAFATRTGRFSRAPGVSMAQPWMLIADRSGTIWVLDQFLGVFTFNSDSMKWNQFEYSALSSPTLNGIYEDAAGRIWIGTRAIDLWVPETRTFKLIPNKAFENASAARPMGTDPRGRLWVKYLGRGVALLDPDSSAFTNFDNTDGLTDPRAIKSLDDGRVMVVGWNGMNLVHPDSLLAPGKAPRLLLSRMTINDTTNVSVYDRTAFPLRLQHEQNVLEFEFSAIDPGQGHLISYAYRLEGLEDSWAEAGTRRFVRYPGLPPGDYVFRVRAANLFGRWPDQEIAVAISIAPPWWKMTRFRIAAIAAIVSLFIFVYRREVGRARRDKQIQQQFSSQQLVFQEAERKRVAAEIHDGLGQSLLIAANELRLIVHEKSRSQSRLKQVTSIIQQSIESAREISANLHPHHLDRLGFCTAIKALARSSGHSSAAVIETECEEIDDILPKATRLHLYRIIQEALANAVRYSQARRIQVSVFKVETGVSAVVRDDGIGFVVKDFSATQSADSVEELHRGFGIFSMSERARLIGGTITIESSPGSGAIVSVNIPIT